MITNQNNYTHKDIIKENQDTSYTNFVNWSVATFPEVIKENDSYLIQQTVKKSVITNVELMKVNLQIQNMGKCFGLLSLGTAVFILKANQ